MGNDHTSRAIRNGLLVATLCAFGWTPLLDGGELPGRIFVSNRDSMTVIDPDDYATPGVIRERYDGPGAGQRGAGEGCRPIGAFGITFTGTSMLRGDVVKLDVESAELNHFLIELDFVSEESVSLFFVIYESITDELEGEYAEWFFAEQLVVGHGPDLYSSGEVGMTMLADRYYVLACAWDVPEITFGLDDVTMPDSFELGTVEARIAINNPFPLEKDPFFDFDNGFLSVGTYSMELCMEPFTGACCSVDDLGDDVCQETFLDICELDPEAFFDGELTECELDTCPLSMGACCIPGDPPQCEERTEFDCTVDGGEYLEDRTTCDGNPCTRTGSCCLADELCDELSETDCDGMGGEYGGDGTECTPELCLAVGACCAEGVCLNLTLDECDGILGTYFGDGTDCATQACPVGACCLGDSCFDGINQLDCEVVTGIYLGDDTICDPETSCECTVDADCPDGETCNTATAQCEGPPSCDGDANGDGLVDPLDSGFVLARFGCPVGTGDSDCDTADQNGDGAVDPLDVGFILARFGPCP